MKKIIDLNYLFWISYIFLILSEMFIGLRYFSSISTIITFLGLVLLSIFILLKIKSYSLRSLVGFSILLLCSFISYIKLKDFTVLKLLILLLSLKDIPFEKFIKKEFKIRSVLFVLVVILSFLGLNLGKQFYIRGNIKRYALGFMHPNAAGFYLFLLAIEYIFINRKEMKGIKYFFPIFLAGIIQMVTNSRTSFLALLFVIVGTIYINKSNNKLFRTKIFQIICSNLFIILSLLIFGVLELYNTGNDLILNFNNLFSNRLYYFNQFVSTYDITFFGNSFDTYILDNAYLHLLLRFGVITYLFYYIIFFKLFKMSFEKKDYTLVIIYIVMLFFGLMENSMYKATYNVFLLGFSEVVFQKERKNEK